MLITIEILIILLLVLFNGFLAASEMAVISSRKIRLRQRAEAGDAGARAALALANEPSRFLSTVQIGITMIGILAGAFGGATLAQAVAGSLEDAGMSDQYSELFAVVLVVLGITYLTLIIGELVPKRLALQFSERIAGLIARPMRAISTVASPVVWFVGISTDAILSLLRARSQAEEPVTEEEIQMIIRESTDAGVLEAAEHEMIRSVFRLADRKVGSLMVPRPDVVWLDIDDPLAIAWQKIRESSHSRFPMCRGDLDTVLGIVSVKDIWAQLTEGREPDLHLARRLAFFVPEHLSVLKALELFRQDGTTLAVVIDEYGGTSGVLSLTDILEAIVGDLPSTEEPAEQRVVCRDDGSWLVDGSVPIDEVKELLQMKGLPDEDQYQTIAGFVLHRLGRIPKSGDYADWGNFRFEVVDMDGYRIDKVLIAPGTTVNPRSTMGKAP